MLTLSERVSQYYLPFDHVTSVKSMFVDYRRSNYFPLLFPSLGLAPRLAHHNNITTFLDHVPMPFMRSNSLLPGMDHLGAQSPTELWPVRVVFMVEYWPGPGDFLSTSMPDSLAAVPNL